MWKETDSRGGSAWLPVGIIVVGHGGDPSVADAPQNCRGTRMQVAALDCRRQRTGLSGGGGANGWSGGALLCLR
jgi:hypothetical protein